MKFVALAVLSLLSLSIDVSGQDISVRARHVLDRMNEQHIQPRKVNDTLSADIFSEFFRVIDPTAELITAADTLSLVKWKSGLEDDHSSVEKFVREATSLYKKRLTWYQHFVDSLLAQPIDLSKAEMGTAVIDYEKNFQKTNGDLKRSLVKKFKMSILMSMYRHAAVDSNNLDDAKKFMSFEPIARQKVLKNSLVQANRFLKDEKALTAYVETSYLRAIPGVFDPNSDYFTNDEMKSFNEALNPSALSFGMKFEESTTGEVSVASVVPGGPAWNSNQINKGDMLAGLKWQSGEYVDLADLDQESLTEILEKSGSTSADFTIRKPTGETRNVLLVKAKLENEDNIVSGFVLKGKNKKRSVGYISLPGFFTDENPQLRGCAVAVTKELIKLKGESIEGLILDLRFNGGGSLGEAIELAGLFIDVGPLGVIESRSDGTITIKDMNRGLVYDGPMVIMVNGASASASEVVAGAMQDYKRAVIAGSTTYGKATGQNIVKVNPSSDQEGFLKITDIRIYRVNGKSHQLQGVSPDFPIKDFTSAIYHREEDSRHSLTPKPINKKIYYTPWSSSFDDVVKLAAANPTTKFENVKVLSDLLTAEIPLDTKRFIAYMKKMEDVTARFENGSNDGIYTVSNSKFDAMMLAMDPYHKEMSMSVMNEISSSIYIQEIYQLLDTIISNGK